LFTGFWIERDKNMEKCFKLYIKDVTHERLIGVFDSTMINVKSLYHCVDNQENSFTLTFADDTLVEYLQFNKNIMLRFIIVYEQYCFNLPDPMYRLEKYSTINYYLSRTIVQDEIPYWDLMLNNVVKSNRNEYFFTENGKKPEINIDECWKDF
jgi:hypothetical protein